MFLYSAKAIIFVPEDKKRVGPSKVASFFFSVSLDFLFYFSSLQLLTLKFPRVQTIL